MDENFEKTACLVSNISPAPPAHKDVKLVGAINNAAQRDNLISI